MYVRESTRGEYGDKLIVVETRKELVLLPSPEDPIEELAEIGGQLGDMSFEELRSSGTKQALEEVTEELRGRQRSSSLT